jgi:hypothetical protein
MVPYANHGVQSLSMQVPWLVPVTSLLLLSFNDACVTMLKECGASSAQTLVMPALDRNKDKGMVHVADDPDPEQ